MHTNINFPPLTVIIPAAGIGSRMKAELPKQYLPLLDRPIIEHTLSKFVDLPFVQHVVVALSLDDKWFHQLPISQHSKIQIVTGGHERADSVLSGLKKAQELGTDWVMVHDAARPCVVRSDIISLYEIAYKNKSAAILGQPVRDTMKRTGTDSNQINETVSRQNLWHAFTPQCCPTEQLIKALTAQINNDGVLNSAVTDEASALEMSGYSVLMCSGSAKNIKVTQPEDISLAEFYLRSENNEY